MNFLLMEDVKVDRFQRKNKVSSMYSL